LTSALPNSATPRLRTLRVFHVNWCGHAQEVIPWLRPDGLVAFVPVLGEAR
jgi:hypothetical protein